jgi:hypothetical protein
LSSDLPLRLRNVNTQVMGECIIIDRNTSGPELLCTYQPLIAGRWARGEQVGHGHRAEGRDVVLGISTRFVTFCNRRTTRVPVTRARARRGVQAERVDNDIDLRWLGKDVQCQEPRLTDAKRVIAASYDMLRISNAYTKVMRCEVLQPSRNRTLHFSWPQSHGYRAASCLRQSQQSRPQLSG